MDESTPKVDQVYKKAAAAYDAGRFKAARTLFVKVAQSAKGKRGWLPWARAAQCDEELGNLREAMRSLRKAERCAPDHDMIQCFIGSLQSDLGRPKLAERALRKAIEIKPSAPTYTVLGVALARQNCRDEAIKCYRAALKLDANYEEAHLNLGVSYRYKGQLKKAETHLRRAVEIDSKYAFAYSELGFVLFKRQAYQESRRVLRRSVRLDSDYYWSRVYLALVNRELRKIKEAEEQYREALRIDPDSVHANSSLGLLLSAETRRNPLPYLEKALSVEPNNEYALYAMGRHLWRYYYNAKATPFLKKAARKGHKGAKKLLAEIEKEKRVSVG